LDRHEQIVIADQVEHAALLELQEVCKCFAWVAVGQKTALSG
jgi:hypothetical protein